MHFCKLCTANPDPVLLLNGTPIAVVEQVKFLDLIFDQQLSFIPHLNIIYPLQAFSSAIFRICGTLHGPSASANLFVLRVSVYSDICVCVCVLSRSDYHSSVGLGAFCRQVVAINKLTKRSIRQCITSSRPVIHIDQRVIHQSI